MNLVPKPRILSYHEARAISFTELRSMESCILKGFLRSRVKATGPTFQNNISIDLICGYIFHKLMKNLPKYFGLLMHQRRKAIRADIAIYIDAYSTQYSDFNFSDHQYWSKLTKTIDSVMTKTSRDLHFAMCREQRIVSKNGLIMGVIDLIEKTADGIQIVDYKCKTHRIDGDTPEHYKKQLHFYALLIQDKYGQFPSECFIEYFSSQRTSVEMDRAVAASLYNTSQIVQNKIQKVIDGKSQLESLATPSDYNCNQCSVNYLCPKFSTTLIESTSYSSSSIVASIISIHSTYVVLQVKYGVVCGNSRIHLHSPSTSLLKALDKNELYFFSNLNYLGDSKYETNSSSWMCMN